MPLAARVGDDHSCPKKLPLPHKGGPVTGPGVSTVIIGGEPAAVVGDKCKCAVGPKDEIKEGSKKVMVGGKPLARVSDPTTHGGEVTEGCPTVEAG